MMSLTRPQFIRAFLIAGMVLTSALKAAAQQPEPLREPSSVPTELAAALASAGGFSAQPQILVGSMPEWIASRVYVPSNARVMGSAFIGTTVVAIVTMPAASDSVLPEYKRELLKRGWTNPPPQQSFGGGFRNASVSPIENQPRVMLCGDGQVITASAARRRGTATDITLRVNTSAGAGLCRPRPLPPGFSRPPYPTLYHPSEALEANMDGSACMRSFNASTGTGSNVRTTLTSEALLEHYGRQLQDSGWKALGQAPTIVGRTWTRADSIGNPMELSITIASKGAAECREINLNVSTKRSQ